MKALVRIFRRKILFPKFEVSVRNSGSEFREKDRVLLWFGWFGVRRKTIFPESVFVVPVQRSEKGSEFYTGSESSEFGEKTLCRPGSYSGETTGSNPGSDGSEKDQAP